MPTVRIPRLGKVGRPPLKIRYDAVVRRSFGKLLAVTLLALCIGFQVLEASGRWDRTFNDANDEGIIVVVVLCVGAALAVAGSLASGIRRSPLATGIVLALTTPMRLASRSSLSIASGSPPLRLRI